MSQITDFVYVDEEQLGREIAQVIYCRHAKIGNFSIPSTVTAICVGAFHGYVDLFSLPIPESAKEIRAMAFSFVVY